MAFTKDLVTSMDVLYSSDANFVKTGMPSPPHRTGTGQRNSFYAQFHALHIIKSNFITKELSCKSKLL